MDTTLQDLTALCVDAERHAKEANREAAAAFFAETADAWGRRDPAGAHADLRRRFDEAHAAFRERLENDRIRRERTTGREALCIEAEGLAGAEDAAGHAGRIHALRDAWQDLPPIPPQYLEILQARFDRALHAFAEAVEAQHREQALKQERMPEIERLCARAEALSEGSEWIAAEQELKNIRKTWLQQVAGLKGMEAVHARFEKALADFARRKEELAQTLADELALLRTLCGELEACLQAADLKSVRAQVKEIASRWKVSEIRDPAKEERQRHFRSLLNTYHRKIHEIFAEEDWARWENYTIKLGLCEKAERLTREPSFSLRLNLIKTLQEEWKRIGPVPREKADEAWARFHHACQAAYQECRAFFDAQAKVRTENLRAKAALCERAEALRDAEDWERTAEALKAMQAEWRSLGNGPRGKEEEACRRFRAACNAFFERRKAHYAEIHRLQAERRKARLAFCEQAEALLASEDPVACIGAAMDLRRQWRDAAPAARGDEHALWSRFNDALGKFFATLDQRRSDNLRRRQAICAEIEQLADSPELKQDGDAVAGAVRRLEEEWRGLGPSPRDQGKDMDDRFRTMLRHFDSRYRETCRDLQAAFAANLAAREAVIWEITETALADTSAAADWRETAATAFATRWQGLGPVAQAAEAELAARFAEALAALRSGDDGHFRAMAAQQQQNLKAKRKLCVELEQLAGAPTSADVDPGNGVSDDLVNELKMAIESNFGMGSGGSQTTHREACDRYERIRKKWHRTGSVPAAEREGIERRFADACAAFTRRHPPGRP
jgi:hypothetical protein